MSPAERMKFFAKMGSEEISLALADYNKADYESTQNRLTQVSILLDRMRAVTRDTAAGIDN